MADFIKSLDLSELKATDRMEIETLKAAYDRAGPKAIAEGMVQLAKRRPDLFRWLLAKLSE